MQHSVSLAGGGMFYCCSECVVCSHSDNKVYNAIASNVQRSVPVVIIAIFFHMRYTMSFYNVYVVLGWMYEERGSGRSISIKTKLWLLCVKAMSGVSRPMLYSFQGSLPKLPVPDLEDTVNRVCQHVLSLFSLWDLLKVKIFLLYADFYDPSCLLSISEVFAHSWMMNSMLVWRDWPKNLVMVSE